jgi:electron transfer flavoprotein alpha subunit
MPKTAVFTWLKDGKLSAHIGNVINAAVHAAAEHPVALYIFGDGADAALAKDAAFTGVDQLIVVNTPGLAFYQTDALGQAAAETVQNDQIDAVVAEAEPASQAILSRAAVITGGGMTSDCTQLWHEGGIRQIKPSFGAQVMVACEVKGTPAYMTMKTSQSYKPNGDVLTPELRTYTGTSAVACTGTEPLPESGHLTGADVVVVAGKGVLESGQFDAVKAYADSIGAALAGSRPVADQGFIPFDDQIGESGTVIQPKLCIIFGVSGAIQFTEGIKGDGTVIAVNNDPNAPIKGFADVFICADIGEFLVSLKALD